MSDITISDPRVEDIATELQMAPEEVLDVAEFMAEVQGLTLDEELDAVEENIHGTALVADAEGGDKDDEDEDEPVAGWTSDPCTGGRWDY